VIPRRILPACAALLLVPAGAGAQWTVEAAAGRAVHDPVSARVATTTASLGLGYALGPAWGYLSGGAPLGGDGPRWGAAGAGGWAGVRRGGARLGIVAGAHAFSYGAAGPNPAGSGGSTELLATAGVERGPLAATLHAGLAAAGEAAGDSSAVRRFADAGVRLTLSGADGLALAGEARLLRGPGGDWPFLGGAAELSRPWGGAWVRTGAWLSRGHPAPAAAYGAGVRLRVGTGTEVQAALRQEPFDPLYRSTPRRSWSVSVSRALGRGPVRAAAAMPRLDAGVAHFRLPLDGGGPPVLIGDFSAWEPVRMAEEGGWWVARVPLTAGVYHYAYRRPDGTVEVPDGVATVDDGFGGRSAVLVVP
jgi:hypothetical protein